jgi:TRAP-type mannitol/chloroaromatic compound transport system substrate-binding protein
LKSATEEVIAEQMAADPMFAKVMESYQDFYNKIKEYHRVSEQEYYLDR